MRFLSALSVAKNGSKILLVENRKGQFSLKDKGSRASHWPIADVNRLNPSEKERTTIGFPRSRSFHKSRGPRASQTLLCSCRCVLTCQIGTSSMSKSQTTLKSASSGRLYSKVSPDAVGDLPCTLDSFESAMSNASDIEAYQARPRIVITWLC